MSEIKVDAITDAAGGNTATINGMTPTADSLQGFRNRIINGDMRIDQRNNGASVPFTLTGMNLYTLDRWQGFKQATGCSFTVARSSVAPEGFNNSALVTITSAVTDTGGSVNALTQFIEGFNTADLGWGTANAQSVTLSFWVRSSLTGTFSCSINNDGYDYCYVANYTISAANTWERKTITIPGPTAGTWIGATNGVGLRLWFDLGTGTVRNGTANAWTASQIYRTADSVQLLANNGATFYITGVQLEAGSVATPFERRPYGTELALCQRYAYASGNSLMTGTQGTSNLLFPITPPVSMRSTPTVSLDTSLTNANYVSTNPSTNQWTLLQSGVAFCTKSGTAGIYATSYANTGVIQVLSATWSTGPNHLLIGNTNIAILSAEL